MKSERFFTEDEMIRFTAKLQDRGIRYETYNEDYFDEFGERWESYVVDYEN